MKERDTRKRPLERWLWANDGRVRAYYCQPRRRDARLPCPRGGGEAGPQWWRRSSSDCYDDSAVLPCVAAMLPRVIEHVRLTWAGW